MSVYHTSSPVLFLIFNRPDTTSLVFEKIREAKPARLYVAADGPRTGIDEEDKLCNATRAVAERIDWHCDLKTLFRENNLGCKYAVSSAIDWFFKQEEEGIILEDDCLPSNDFFRFCDVLLEKYRNDTRIIQVAGCNSQAGTKWGKYSYYFSKNLEIWGWATWRRAWQKYDVELSRFVEEDVEETFNKIFEENLIVESCMDIFRRLKNKEIDTWDYQLKFISLFNNGLCIIPNVNLISNIGFRPDATHTVSPDDINSNRPIESLSYPIQHPQYIIPENEADRKLLNEEFNIEERKRKQNKISRRIRRWLTRYKLIK